MDAICLVCESAFGIEGVTTVPPDLQMECPNCQMSVLVLDDEEVSHSSQTLFKPMPTDMYDDEGAAILSAPPTSPQDVLEQASLGRPAERSSSPETRPPQSSASDILASFTSASFDDFDPLSPDSYTLHTPEDLTQTLPNLKTIDNNKLRKSLRGEAEASSSVKAPSADDLTPPPDTLESTPPFDEAPPAESTPAPQAPDTLASDAFPTPSSPAQPEAASEETAPSEPDQAVELATAPASEPTVEKPLAPSKAKDPALEALANHLDSAITSSLLDDPLFYSEANLDAMDEAAQDTVDEVTQDTAPEPPAKATAPFTSDDEEDPGEISIVTPLTPADMLVDSDLEGDDLAMETLTVSDDEDPLTSEDIASEEKPASTSPQAPETEDDATAYTVAPRPEPEEEIPTLEPEEDDDEFGLELAAPVMTSKEALQAAGPAPQEGPAPANIASSKDPMSQTLTLVSKESVRKVVEEREAKQPPPPPKQPPPSPRPEPEPEPVEVREAPVSSPKVSPRTPGDEPPMIDFDALSQEFFEAPAVDPDAEHEAELYALLKQQQEESKRIIKRIVIIAPVVIVATVLMFWGINYSMKKPSPEVDLPSPPVAKRRETKRPQPRARKVAMAVRDRVPAQAGSTAPLTDAGAAAPPADRRDAPPVDRGDNNNAPTQRPDDRDTGDNTNDAPDSRVEDRRPAPPVVRPPTPAQLARERRAKRQRLAKERRAKRRKERERKAKERKAKRRLAKERRQRRLKERKAKRQRLAKERKTRRLARRRKAKERARKRRLARERARKRRLAMVRRRAARRRPAPRRTRRSPATAKKHYQAGMQAFVGGNLPSAEKQLKKALGANPRFADAHRVLGMTYMRMQKKAKARRHLKTFLRLAPKHPIAGMIRNIIKTLK